MPVHDAARRWEAGGRPGHRVGSLLGETSSRHLLSMDPHTYTQPCLCFTGVSGGSVEMRANGLVGLQAEAEVALLSFPCQRLRRRNKHKLAC